MKLQTTIAILLVAVSLILTGCDDNAVNNPLSKQPKHDIADADLEKLNRIAEKVLNEHPSATAEELWPEFLVELRKQNFASEFITDGAAEGSVAAGPTPWPINDFIYDVTPRPDGVISYLSGLGLEAGVYWSSSRIFAQWTIQEYERQSGQNWPYNQRSLDSIANEIWFHCLVAFTPLWPRVTDGINMGFNESGWEWD
jgi:hypothetical protein